MRVKLGHRIRFCTVATHRDDSKLILLTTDNGVYTVEMKSWSEAGQCFEMLLTNGYYDFSECDYSN